MFDSTYLDETSSTKLNRTKESGCWTKECNKMAREMTEMWRQTFMNSVTRDKGRKQELSAASRERNIEARIKNEFKSAAAETSENKSLHMETISEAKDFVPISTCQRRTKIRTIQYEEKKEEKTKERDHSGSQEKTRREEIPGCSFSCASTSSLTTVYSASST